MNEDHSPNIQTWPEKSQAFDNWLVDVTIHRNEAIAVGAHFLCRGVRKRADYPSDPRVVAYDFPRSVQTRIFERSFFAFAHAFLELRAGESFKRICKIDFALEFFGVEAEDR